MARAAFSAFKAARTMRRVGKVERWFAERPEVLAVVVAQIAAGEQYKAIYDWLMSDDAGDVPDFTICTLANATKNPAWAELIATAGM